MAADTSAVTARSAGASAPKAACRPTRADAARNYDKLIAAARALYADEGIEVAMEKVAGAAGVGIGTLYRHFPNRTALVEAAFREQATEIVSQGWQLVENGPADAALAGVIESYMRSAATKRGMKEAILAASGGDAPVFLESRENSRKLMEAIVTAGQEQGLFRTDVTAIELQRIAGGLSMACNPDDTPEVNGRLISIVLDGLRPA
ncbi:transcriptional regulator, TetR family [Williamsia sterculiae]|uniref:Transcriptional regulator, TetR family n=2 Tax=Williamsia sterculiae TaxID=1344003 RepID=A0A1N7FVW3_9NOCA|nr:transcriptional regulator, TetR family [Williamsia sterculiae]